MKPIFTIAAISDIHTNKYPIKKDFFDIVNDTAKLLIIGGDMNNGKDKEVSQFLELVSGVHIPILIVLGNHDYDFGEIEKIKDVLSDNDLTKILDGEYTEYFFNDKRIGISGTKGYGGGFAPNRIIGCGEKSTKEFVKEEEREAKKLETAIFEMIKASPDFRITLTHWATFEETVIGEPKELYIMLGSSKIGDVIEKAYPHIALSGHAHHGAKGIKKARGKISACNISYDVNDGKMPLFDFFPNGDVKLRHHE